MSRLHEDQQAQARVAEVTRDSYGRLLAVLTAPTRDIAAAEDALADAFERALVRWPDDGIPANPEGWLLTVARNRLRDLWKSSGYLMTEPLTESDYASTTLDDDMAAIPDRRLELMLVCAHPAEHSHAADAAVGARCRSRGDRHGLRGRAGDHGAAACAGQETHPRRGHPVRPARTRRPGRTAARRVGGGVRRIRDRLAAGPS